jgi:hypothetical protein
MQNLPVHFHENFCFKLLWPKELILAQDELPRVFKFDYEFTDIFKFSCILRNLSIQTVSFCVFSVFGKFHLVYFKFMDSFFQCVLRNRW